MTGRAEHSCKKEKSMSATFKESLALEHEFREFAIDGPYLVEYRRGREFRRIRRSRISSEYRLKRGINLSFYAGLFWLVLAPVAFAFHRTVHALGPDEFVTGLAWSVFVAGALVLLFGMRGEWTATFNVVDGEVLEIRCRLRRRDELVRFCASIPEPGWSNGA
jgi:hypothetical protein